jgi:hypothetical protein
MSLSLEWRIPDPCVPKRASFVVPPSVPLEWGIFQIRASPKCSSLWSGGFQITAPPKSRNPKQIQKAYVIHRSTITQHHPLTQAYVFAKMLSSDIVSIR